MQTSCDASGENAVLPCRTTSGKQQRPVGTPQKPKRGRKACCVGRPGRKKQRPECRVPWRRRHRHWDLDFYGRAVAQEMHRRHWTERDLAAAAAIHHSSIHKIIAGKVTPDLEQDRRLHRAFALKLSTLSFLAYRLRQRAKKGRAPPASK